MKKPTPVEVSPDLSPLPVEYTRGPHIVRLQSKSKISTQKKFLEKLRKKYQKEPVRNQDLLNIMSPTQNQTDGFAGNKLNSKKNSSFKTISSLELHTGKRASSSKNDIID